MRALADEHRLQRVPQPGEHRDAVEAITLRWNSTSSLRVADLAPPSTCRLHSCDDAREPGENGGVSRW
ncbi:hypothetical protein GCM10020220_090130 [Nonomuraea rubra]